MAKAAAKSASEIKKLLYLPTDHVTPDPNQPRKYFDPTALEELKKSIEHHGVLQPILVREDTEGNFIIIAGERRHRAASELGLAEIPAIQTGGNPQEIALVENLLREDLTAVEEAEALQSMIEKYEYKQEDLARVLGKAESTISEILSINKLPQEIRDEARENPKCSRRVLIEIVRSKKRKNGMLTLYNKYKERGLTSAEIKKQARGPREIQPREVFYQITGLKNRFQSLTIDGWTEEDREKLAEEVNLLIKVISEKLELSNS